MTTSPPAIRTVDPALTDAALVSLAVPGVAPGAANPAWSRNATKLAYSTPQGISVIDADGTNGRILVRDPAGAIDPTWSPDGGQIAFTSLRNGSPDIYVINVDGTGERRLTSEPTIEQQPDWSPDPSANWIAYESDRTGNLDIWRMAPDGSAQTRLTTDPADDSDAAWSPDGERLAFSSGAPGATREIYSIDRGGGDGRQLTTLGTRSTFPAWSPDAKQIAFTAYGGVQVMPSTGGQPRQLIGGAADPVWARLPEPVVKAVGDVQVDPPGAGGARDATVGQPLPKGTAVDATNGAIVIKYSKPTAPPSTPDSTMRVQGAEFTVAESTPDALTVKLKPVECPSSAVQAAASKGKSKVVSKSSKKGAKGKVKNKDIHTSPYGTVYSVTETCRGTTVFVTTGSVDVQVLHGKRRTVRVTARHSLFVAS